MSFLISPKLHSKIITSDHSLAPTDNPVIIVDTSEADDPVTLTLFNSNTQANDNLLHRYWVHKIGGTQPLDIVVNEDENFADGLTKFRINRNGKTLQLGNMYHSTNPMWLRISHEQIYTRIRMTSTVNRFDGNIPFGTVDEEDDDAVTSWGASSNPDKLNIIFGGRYELTAALSINSTGGGTWNLEMRILRNGALIIPGSSRTTGNSGGEDDSLIIERIVADLDSGDYLQLAVNHTNLTGNYFDGILTTLVSI